MHGESQERRWTLHRFDDRPLAVAYGPAVRKGRKVEVMPVSEHTEIAKGLVEELEKERLRLRSEERTAAKQGKRSLALAFEREANGIERALEILRSHLEGGER